jgi:hypothetical protein
MICDVSKEFASLKGFTPKGSSKQTQCVERNFVTLKGASSATRFVHPLNCRQKGDNVSSFNRERQLSTSRPQQVQYQSLGTWNSKFQRTSPGIASGSGPRGRRFKSSLPDHFTTLITQQFTLPSQHWLSVPSGHNNTCRPADRHNCRNMSRAKASRNSCRFPVLSSGGSGK